MARRSRAQLSESWAMMDEDDSRGSNDESRLESEHTSPPGDASYVDIRPSPPRSSRRQTPVRHTRNPAASTGPTLIMPSIEQPRQTPCFNPLPEESPIPRTRGSRRKHSSGDTHRTTKPRGNTPRQRRSSDQRTRSSSIEEESNAPQLFEGVTKYLLWPSLKILWRISSSTISLIAPWVPLILAIWIITGLIYFSINFAYFSVSNALSPLCNVPLVAWYWSGYCGPRISPPSAPEELDELIILQSSLEDVLSSSTSNNVSSLPMDITRSVLHLSELRHNVRVSKLPSKNELVLELEAFHESANDASSKLGSYGSSIGRAVDKIITTNRWTLRKLDSIAHADAERGFVERFKDDIMSPFRPRIVRYDEILEQYLQHTDVIEEQITNLILEAHALVKALQLLDNRLDTIAFITKRDGIDIADAKDELLARLWTYFGGNKYEVKQIDRKLALISDLSKYRQLAVAHVLATIRKLEGIQNGLKDLRERIVQPGLDVGRRDMPLEWHIYNIQLGLERLELQKMESNRALDQDLSRYYDSKGGRRDEGRMIEGRMTTVDAGA
ncbi:MAG: hypothetical protein Q9157_006484 [Trypethelium eluteriae]